MSDSWTKKKTAAGAHKKNHEQVAQFDFWSWGCTFHEQGSWTRGIFTEQRKLYRLILFLLATKRAWSAPGPKIEFVYERIMRRLWVFHEWLHLAAGSQDRGILKNSEDREANVEEIMRESWEHHERIMRISMGRGAGKKVLAANTYPIDEYESKHYLVRKHQPITPSIE